MITFSFTVARPSVTVKADGALPSGITVLTGQSGSGKSTFYQMHRGPRKNPQLAVFNVMKRHGLIEIKSFGCPLKSAK